MTWIGRFKVERKVWRWFHKPGMIWVAVVKIKAPGRPWLVCRGDPQSGRLSRFSSLHDAFESLYDIEIETLIESEGLHPLEALALACAEPEEPEEPEEPVG